MNRPPGPVLVMGAGAIGCFLGGALQSAGAEVHLVGRAKVLDTLRKHGLTLTDLDGGRRCLEGADLQLHADLPEGLKPALVLLCVKSGGTVAAARALAALPAGSLVLSMQNGLHNAELAAEQAPALTILPGMVAFNVTAPAPGHWHRGTSGTLAAQTDPALRDWLPWFAAAGLPLQLHADLKPVQWGKLLLNLNNPINALSGLPLRAQLLDAGHRRLLAAAQREALGAMARAGIRPARVGPAPPALLPLILSLPTPLFRLISARMLRVDAKARSSMADDLAQGRPTEVDALCGEVVRLAERHGGDAPLNRSLVTLMTAVAQQPPRQRDADTLRRELAAC